MKLRYQPGTRYSDSVIYDAATTDVVHGWQVFEQFREDGKPTGSRSFVNNAGTLCGISIAKAQRESALHAAAPELVAALRACTARLEHRMRRDSAEDLEALAMARAAMLNAVGIEP